MIANRRNDAVATADHAPGIGLRHRLLGRHGGIVARTGAEQKTLAVLADAGGS
jgi:hypothetical protein